MKDKAIELMNQETGKELSSFDVLYQLIVDHKLFSCFVFLAKPGDSEERLKDISEKVELALRWSHEHKEAYKIKIRASSTFSDISLSLSSESPGLAKNTKQENSL